MFAFSPAGAGAYSISNFPKKPQHGILIESSRSVELLSVQMGPHIYGFHIHSFSYPPIGGRLLPSFILTWGH